MQLPVALRFNFVLCLEKFSSPKFTGLPLPMRNLNYDGSITIDPVLMRLANIREYEKLQVVDLNNGARFETYCIRGKPEVRRDLCEWGRGAFGANRGFSHRHGFYLVNNSELEGFSPKVVKVDMKNQPLNS